MSSWSEGVNNSSVYPSIDRTPWNIWFLRCKNTNQPGQQQQWFRPLLCQNPHTLHNRRGISYALSHLGTVAHYHFVEQEGGQQHFRIPRHCGTITHCMARGGPMMAQDPYALWHTRRAGAGQQRLGTPRHCGILILCRARWGRGSPHHFLVFLFVFLQHICHSN